MENKVIAPSSDASSIYEGGDISTITAEQLKGNIIAIRQLINGHNITQRESKNKDTEIKKLTAENEYLNTAPFVSIIAAIVSIVGTLIIGLASEKIGNELQVVGGDISLKSICLIISGLVLILVGSFATILYPKARGWFNNGEK